MKRFLLFAGERYYPDGGFEDLIATSDDIHALKSRIEGSPTSYDWAQIFDSLDDKADRWEWNNNLYSKTISGPPKWKAINRMRFQAIEIL